MSAGSQTLRFCDCKTPSRKKLFCDDICDGLRRCLIGYARVSTDDQNLDLQRTALADAGCTRIYEEKLSGANRNRPELARLLDHLRGGDVVVVYRLDRLARSTRDLLEIAEQLKEADAGLRSLSEPWADTTSPAGRMVLTVFAGIAEFERTLIHERTGAGLAAAHVVRPPSGCPRRPRPYGVERACRAWPRRLSAA